MTDLPPGAAASPTPSAGSPVESPRDAVWLGRICLGLAALLLTAWASTRWKPVLAFGPLFGAILGLSALALQNWFPAPSRREWRIAVAVWTVVGVTASFWISSERTHAAAAQAGHQGLADALMNTLQELPTDASAIPTTPTERVKLSDKTPWDRFRTWHQRHYSPLGSQLIPWGLLLELLLAMVTGFCVAGGLRRGATAVPTQEQVP